MKEYVMNRQLRFSFKDLAFPIIATLVLSVFLSLVYFNREEINRLYQGFFGKLPEVRQVVEEKIAQEIRKQVNTAPGIRAKEESPQSFLTVDGVISITNRHRLENNLPLLATNILLNQSALNKARDMLDKQYFAHDSPEGKSVGDLAGDVGYEFIAIGENLAMGNFLDDEALVQGWMDSPGHRANILNNRYRELGVAVVRGVYQGRSTWMAVQHFGFPLSACPQPDNELEENLEENKTRLDALQQEIERKREDLEQTQPKHGPQYNQKVDEYNTLVNQYNALVAETKGLIEEFNNQVEAFNQCAS